MLNRTSTEEKALKLLGSGLNPEQVASACGVTPARISQLLSDEHFAADVAELRFTNLSKHNERDSSYDTLEDKLLEKMRDCIPLMYKPAEILRAIQVINSAKRRGQSSPDQVIQQQKVVQLVLPTQIIQQFTVSGHNQVTQVGDQQLLTMQANTLLKRVQAEAKDITHVQTSPTSKGDPFKS